MNRPSPDPIPAESMLGKSDWDDEDLLTVVEATDRLGMEIAAARERIRQHRALLASDDRARVVGVESALAAECARLDELVEADKRIKEGQSRAPTAG